MADILSGELAEALAGADEVLAAGGEEFYLKQLRFDAQVDMLKAVKVMAVEKAQFRVRQLAMLSLVARGKGATAERLRTEIHTLDLWGSDGRWDRTRNPMDLWRLGGLRLKKLSIDRSSEILWPEAMNHLEELHVVRCDVERLPAAPGLEKLVASDLRLSRLDLRDYPALRWLELSAYTAYAHAVGLPSTSTAIEGLEESSLEHLDLSTKSDQSLKAPRSLRSLRWWCPKSMIALEDQPALTQISLGQWGASDLRDLGRCGQLETLSLGHMDQLKSLEGLPTGKLKTLRIQACEHLDDLSALKRAPRLLELDLRRCAALHDLGALDGLPSLTKLTLNNLDSLRRLSLGSLPGLSQLVVYVCSKLGKVSVSTECRALKQVDLRACGKEVGLDVMGLEGLELEWLGLSSSRIGKTRIPESLWPVVKPAGLVKKRRRTKSNKPAPKRAKGSARGQAARLKKLILSRDLDRIDQAAELVGILGEEVSCAITHGCVLKRDAPLMESLPKTANRAWSGSPAYWDPTWDKLVPNRLLDHADLLMPYRGHALRVLAAAGGAPELADARSLVMVGRSKLWRGRVPVRLDPLSELKQLERVGVYECEVLEGVQVLEGLKRFCGYEIGGITKVAEVAGSREIALVASGRSGLQSIGWDERLGHLEKLQVSHYGFEVVPEDLARLASLRSLSLSLWGPVGIEAVKALGNTLDELELNVREWAGPTAGLMEALGVLALRHLGISSAPLGGGFDRQAGVRVASSLEGLSELGLDSLRLYGTDFEALDQLEPGLKNLSLADGGHGRLDLDRVGCSATVEHLEIQQLSKRQLVSSPRRPLFQADSWPCLKVLRIPQTMVTPELAERYEVRPPSPLGLLRWT